MDLTNDIEIREFVKRTINNHKEIDFTSKDFTIQINGLPDTSGFVNSYENAKEEIKNNVNNIIDNVFNELEKKCCCILF